MKKGLILKAVTSDYDEKLVNSLNEYGKELVYDLRYYNAINFLISSEEIKITIDGIDLTDYDFVFFKKWRDTYRYAIAISHFLQHKGIPYVDANVDSYVSFDKLTQMMIFAANDLPIPKTFFSTQNSYTFTDLNLLFGERFILKDISGSKGEANFLISSQTDIDEAQTSYPDVAFVAQEFIDNNYDYRIGILGDEVGYVKKRMRLKESTSHLNNISQGAQVMEVSPQETPEEYITVAKKANQLMGLSLGGVDVIIDKNERPYLLEVNQSPAITNHASTLAAVANYFDMLIK